MKTVSALVAGVLFGTGLALSGMLDPVRVLDFLDLAGTWDPTLAFVLGGAVAVSAVGYQIARRQQHPAFADRFDIPTGTRIDVPLLAGAAIFGVGWGLSGFCPGPALASLSLGLPKSAGFVAAMLLGMALHSALTRWRAGARQSVGSAA